MKIILVLGVLYAMIYTNSAWIMDCAVPSIHKGKINEFYTKCTKSRETHPINNKLKIQIDFPNQCYVLEDKKGYPIGTTNPIGVCKSVECNSDFTYSQSG